MYQSMHQQQGPGRGRKQHRPQYGPRRPKHNVPVNIEHTDGGFEARIFCVGFPKDRIQITLTNNVIYISGTRQPEHPEPDFMLQEYPVKSFERWFELSDQVDQQAISARFEEGILIIQAPVKPEARGPEREVPIQ
ncbi:HSP20 family protein [Neolewinella xylanilytica]|uniref:HSP20 family protein n=1 Tax=Neolewinella xylanilytica TaxID=1514080 RepID=A0A2S6IAU0_9BACT|nr:Hsp20/alpha crystallin family protein [Neolewinella xylanilytica]PPK88596.1 HSP20 family protein [Neolewinella xylanilytica]